MDQHKQEMPMKVTASGRYPLQREAQHKLDHTINCLCQDFLHVCCANSCVL